VRGIGSDEKWTTGREEKTDFGLTDKRCGKQSTAADRDGTFQK
jgi:hypothetical protein